MPTIKSLYKFLKPRRLISFLEEVVGNAWNPPMDWFFA